MRENHTAIGVMLGKGVEPLPLSGQDPKLKIHGYEGRWRGVAGVR